MYWGWRDLSEPIVWSQGSENSDLDFGLKVSAVYMTASIFTRELANKKLVRQSGHRVGYWSHAKVPWLCQRGEV
jgi:hypothetical protein